MNLKKAIIGMNVSKGGKKAGKVFYLLFQGHLRHRGSEERCVIKSHILRMPFIISE